MEPSKEWLALYNEKKKIMCPESSLEKYFTDEYVSDVKLKVVNMGKLSVTSGELIVIDPVYFYDEIDVAPILDKFPKGKFDVYGVLSEEEDEDGIFHNLIAVKVQFTDNEPVTYREIVTGQEDIEILEGIESQGDLIGTDIFSNMVSIMDRDTAEELADFAVKEAEEDEEFDIKYEIYQEHLDKSNADNVIQGQFALFSPISSERNMFIADNIYAEEGEPSYFPAYIAEDKDGNICQLVLQFYDLEIEPDDSDD